MDWTILWWLLVVLIVLAGLIGTVAPADLGRPVRQATRGGAASSGDAVRYSQIVVAEVALTGQHGADFRSVDYRLTPDVLASREVGTYRRRFVAGSDSIAGGIYGIRLLREQPDS